LKTILYVAIPILVFGIVLSNALFGHLILASSYEQDINKYSIYVHLQPEWNSYPSNIIFDVTNVWSNFNSTLYNHNPDDISGLIAYNSNQLQSQNGKFFVELKHEFSDCKSSWNPISYRYAIDSVRNQIELMKGTQLNDNPYISIVPNITSSQNELIQSEYVQFKHLKMSLHTNMQLHLITNVSLLMPTLFHQIMNYKIIYPQIPLRITFKKDVQFKITKVLVGFVKMLEKIQVCCL